MSSVDGDMRDPLPSTSSIAWGSWCAIRTAAEQCAIRSGQYVSTRVGTILARPAGYAGYVIARGFVVVEFGS